MKKRKSEILTQISSIIPDSTDDAISNSRSPEPVAIVAVTNVPHKKEGESGELRVQLDQERRLRRHLEERVHALEAQIYPASGREIPHAVNVVHFEETEDAAECKLENVEVELPVVEATTVAAPLLEAAIKAEPRVEVEVLPEASSEAPSRLYLASTSRQNLETIVEAIRHLEGDHLFREEGSDAPLALTKKAERAPLAVPPAQRPGVIVVKHS